MTTHFHHPVASSTGSNNHGTDIPRKEVMALVQFIELNKSGWWKKTIEQMVLSTIWLANGPLSINDIQQSLHGDYKLNIDCQKLEPAIQRLRARGLLANTSLDQYKITEAHRPTIDKDIAQSESSEQMARQSFLQIAERHGLKANAEAMWDTFDRHLLGPVLHRIGAGAHHILSGSKLHIEDDLLDPHLRKFPEQSRSQMRLIIGDYLDPSNDAARDYIGRLLHALFCVEASGLPEDIIGKLGSKSGRPIQFLLFADTNFLFSLMDLHENPANASARELLSIIQRLNGNIRIKVYASPETIEEAKSSITATKHMMAGFPAGRNFAKAGITAGISGVGMKFLMAREQGTSLSSAEWFDPYLKDFVPLARSKGVELYNDRSDSYSTRQDVIDDIGDVMRFEEMRLPEERRKSYEKVRHDVVLWHMVNDKRPGYVESPTDASYWVVTVDRRLLAFDVNLPPKPGHPFRRASA
jgi:hypothetical protein